MGLCIQCAGQREQEGGPDPGPLIPSPSLKSLPGTEAEGSQSGQLQLQPRNPERLAWGRVTWAAGVLPAPSVSLQPNPRSTALLLLPSSGLWPLGRTLQAACWLSSSPRPGPSLACLAGGISIWFFWGCGDACAGGPSPLGPMPSWKEGGAWLPAGGLPQASWRVGDTDSQTWVG